MEGDKNLFREKILANLGKESIGKFKGILEVVSSTPSPVGRRIAPRIPLGRFMWLYSLAVLLVC